MANPAYDRGPQRVFNKRDFTTVTDTTTESTWATETIPAFSLQVGDYVEFEALAHVTDQNSTDTVDAWLKAKNPDGAYVTLAEVTAAHDVGDDDYVRLRGSFTVGAARLDGVGYGQIEGEAELLTVIQDTTLSHGLDIVLDCRATWSVAHAENILVPRAFVVRVTPSQVQT